MSVKSSQCFDFFPESYRRRKVEEEEDLNLPKFCHTAGGNTGCCENTKIVLESLCKPFVPAFSFLVISTRYQKAGFLLIL